VAAGGNRGTEAVGPFLLLVFRKRWCGMA
jgi:hypothetical protein